MAERRKWMEWVVCSFLYSWGLQDVNRSFDDTSMLSNDHRPPGPNSGCNGRARTAPNRRLPNGPAVRWSALDSRRVFHSVTIRSLAWRAPESVRPRWPRPLELPSSRCLSNCGGVKPEFEQSARHSLQSAV